MAQSDIHKMKLDPFIVEILTETKKEYEAKIKDYTDKLHIIMLHLDGCIPESFYKQIELPDIGENKYPESKKEKRKYTVPNKTEAIDPVAEIITKANRFLSKIEIEEMLETPVRALSSVLSTAKRKGKHNITNYMENPKAQKLAVWGFLRYLDEDGKPKPEHMPKAKAS